jgi:hypothetical protein
MLPCGRLQRRDGARIAEAGRSSWPDKLTSLTRPVGALCPSAASLAAGAACPGGRPPFGGHPERGGRINRLPPTDAKASAFPRQRARSRDPGQRGAADDGPSTSRRTGSAASRCWQRRAGWGAGGPGPPPRLGWGRRTSRSVSRDREPDAARASIGTQRKVLTRAIAAASGSADPRSGRAARLSRPYLDRRAGRRQRGRPDRVAADPSMAGGTRRPRVIGPIGVDESYSAVSPCVGRDSGTAASPRAPPRPP